MAQFFTTIALANHQVGLVICRALHALGELPESELKKLLIPKFSEDDKTTQWDDSLKALKRVKIVLEEPGIVKLSESLQSRKDIDSTTFAEEFLRGLVEVNIETIEEGKDPDDLFKSLIWLATLPTGYSLRKLDEKGNPDSPYQRLKAFGFEGVIANTTQWSPFRRWVRGLGLSREFKDGDCIDFSDVVHNVIINSEVNGAVTDLILQLELVLPLLSNKKLQAWYSGIVGKSETISFIDEQLGWALFTAEQKGIITFRSDDDTLIKAVVLPFDTNGKERIFTHVQKVA